MWKREQDKKRQREEIFKIRYHLYKYFSFPLIKKIFQFFVSLKMMRN